MNHLQADGRLYDPEPDGAFVLELKGGLGQLGAEKAAAAPHTAPAGAGSQAVGKCPRVKMAGCGEGKMAGLRGEGQAADGRLELHWSGTLFKPHFTHGGLRSRGLEYLCLPLLGGGTRESLGPTNNGDKGSLYRSGQGSGKDL